MKAHRSPTFSRRPVWRAVAVGMLLLVATMSLAQEAHEFRSSLVALEVQAQRSVAGGNIEQAIEYLREAIREAQNQHDLIAEAALYISLGNAREKTARYQAALSLYEDGLRSLNRDRGIETSYIDNVLERLENQTKQYRADGRQSLGAEPVPITIALQDLFREAPNRARAQVLLALFTNAGNMYLRQYQTAPAETLYSAAVRHTTAAGVDMSTKLYLNLAWLAILHNGVDEAVEWIGRARALGGSVNTAGAFLAAGVLERDRAQWDRSVQYLRQALQLYRDEKNRPGHARAAAHLGHALTRMGDCKQAMTAFTEALELAGEDLESQWLVHGGMARCMKQLGKTSGAKLHFDAYLDVVQRIGDQFASDEGKVSYFESHTSLLQEYVELLVTGARETGAFEELRELIDKIRARTMLALQSTIQNPRLKPGRFYARYLAADALATDWMRMVLELDQNMVNETVTVTESGSFLETPKLKTVTPPDVTFLEYYLLRESMVITVRSAQGSARSKVVRIGGSGLAEKIAGYREAMGSALPRGLRLDEEAGLQELQPAATAEEVQSLSRELYDILISPVRSFLDDNTKRPIAIVPHMSLWALPFAALLDEKNTYFGGQFEIAYAPSRESWQDTARYERKRNHRNARAWVVGNPRLENSVEKCGQKFVFAPLPGAEQEAKAIHQLFRGKRKQSSLFIGAQADRLRLEAWHADASVIHLATHGVACPEAPLSSFLVLSSIRPTETAWDARTNTVALTNDPRKLVHIDNRGSAFPLFGFGYSGVLDARMIHRRFSFDADLVTLSACQTGLGRVSNEGVLGFTRAFLAAGARSVLVSLWRVDDVATKQLMVVFYREYLEHGNKAKALQRAMAKTRERYPEPKYWAAFRLLGMAE